MPYTYDFDKKIERRNTQSSKWDNVGARVGNPEALPMWVADTDFPCPEPIVKAVQERAAHPIYGYPYVVPEFYTVTAEWVTRRYGWKIEPQWAIYTLGVVPVINTAIQAFSEPGDEIVILPPVYHPFAHAVRDNDRVVSGAALIYENGRFDIDFEELEKRLASPKAKLLICCSPHNPSGRVWNEEELRKVAEMALKHNVLVVCDEIHADVMLFGHKHIPMASLDERFAQNTITCYAPSKTFNIAGLRGSGIIIPNESVRKAMQKRFTANRAIQQNVFALPAYLAAYTECDDYIDQLIPYLEGNVKFIDSFLRENMPKIKLMKPDATFLAWLDCSELGMDADELADFFINKAKVAVNRGDSFGKEGAIFERINFGCPRSTLEEGLKRLKAEYDKLG